MTLKTVLAAITAAVLGSAAAHAAELWGLEAFNDVCPVSFSTQPTAGGLMQIRHHSQGCRGGLDNITDWSEEGDGGTFYFYDRAGQLMGRVDGMDGGTYSGVFGDGTPLEMRFIGHESTSDGGAQYNAPSGSGAGEAQGCRVYHGTRRCAEPYDIGAPDGAQIMPLARMNVRFSSGLTSQVVATVDRGSCLEVSRCRDEPFADERFWCEVQLEGRSGWVLKQDEATVYTRNICD